MNKELIEACKMFLVPATILFAAIAVAQTEPLKALLSAMGLGLSTIWFWSALSWQGTALGDSDKIATYGLASIFWLASLISMVVHLLRWGGVISWTP